MSDRLLGEITSDTLLSARVIGVERGGGGGLECYGNQVLLQLFPYIPCNWTAVKKAIYFTLARGPWL